MVRLTILRFHHIGVSTYSFWLFRGEPVPIEKCLERAADMGFDGVEIPHVHMEEAAKASGGSVDRALLRRIKQRAFALGLDLMGFSTHQGFVTPDGVRWDYSTVVVHQQAGLCDLENRPMGDYEVSRESSTDLRASMNSQASAPVKMTPA